MPDETLDAMLRLLVSQGEKVVGIDDVILLYQNNRVLLEVRNADNPVLRFALMEASFLDVDTSRLYVSVAVPVDSLPLGLRANFINHYVCDDSGNTGLLYKKYASTRDGLIGEYAGGSITPDVLMERFRREVKPAYDSMAELCNILLSGLVRCHPSQLETLPG